MTEKEKLEHAADRYMKAASERFAKKVKQRLGLDEFANGFTWGARAGYLAGFRAASRKRASSRRSGDL